VVLLAEHAIGAAFVSDARKTELLARLHAAARAIR